MEEGNITTGINIDEDTKRYYPNNNLASQIMRFVEVIIRDWMELRLNMIRYFLEQKVQLKDTLMQKVEK